MATDVSMSKMQLEGTFDDDSHKTRTDAVANGQTVSIIEAGQSAIQNANEQPQAKSWIT